MMLFIGKKVIHLVCILGFAGDPAQRLGLRLGSARASLPQGVRLLPPPKAQSASAPGAWLQARRKFLGLVLPLGTSV